MAFCRTTIILNPHAGSAEAGDRIRELLPGLGDVRVVETACEGDAGRLAREALDSGSDCIAAAGGDGTLHGVLNGIAPDFDRVAIGLLPLGTGNDFARSIGVPDTIDEALAVLEQGRTLELDVIRIRSGDETWYACNASSGGFSCVIDEKLEETDKSRLGVLAYAVSAGKAVPEIERYGLRVRVDDGETIETEAYNFAVSNGRFLGGGLPMASRARLTDGRLDLVILPCLSVPRLTLVLPKLLLGTHVDDEDLVVRTGRRFEIDADPRVPFNGDGEPLGETPVIYEALPRSLRVVVGRLAEEIEDDEKQAASAET